MNGLCVVEKLKLPGCELAEVSKLPEEEAIKRQRREALESKQKALWLRKEGNKILRERGGEIDGHDFTSCTSFLQFLSFVDLGAF